MDLDNKYLEKLVGTTEEFEAEATELKSAEVIQQQKMTDLNNQINESFEEAALGAQLLQTEARNRDWAEVVEELGNLKENWETADPGQLGSEITLAEAGGLSDRVLAKGYELGQEFLKTKKFKKASRIFRLIALLDSTVPGVWRQLAMSLMGQAKYQEAEEVIQAAILEESDEPLNYLTLSLCKGMEGNLEEAHAHMEQALELFREVPDKMHQAESQIEFVKATLQFE